MGLLIVLGVLFLGWLAWILVGPGAVAAEAEVWRLEREERHRVAEEMVRQWKVRQLGRKR